MSDDKKKGMPSSLMGVAGNVAGGLMGLATAGWQDKRQLKQNQKLQDQNIAGQMKMGEFNRKQALKMWEDTGYVAQKDQMKRAGLNAGLMYGGTGSGGSTAGGAGAPIGSGVVSQGEVGQGMALGMQGAMMEAQIKNINADTKNKEANTGSTGQDIETKRMANWLQGMFQNDTEYIGEDKYGNKLGMKEIITGLEDGSIDNPALKQKVLEMLEVEAKKESILSSTEEQNLKNEARKLGVTDLDDMFIRMGARYAIENENIDKNDARFALVAAQAGVALFEMFSKFGMAKSLTKGKNPLSGVNKPIKK